MTKRIVLLQALASTPTDLRRLLKDVDDADARRRPGPEEWSLLDIVAHLNDIEERYRKRLKRVITADNPSFAYLHPAASGPTGVPLSLLLKQFEMARGETLGFLSSLSQRDWSRPAVHETLGETRFQYLVQNLLDHDIVHLRQVADVCRYVRAEQRPSSDAQPAVSILE